MRNDVVSFETMRVFGIDTVGWGANPNIVVLIDMAMLGFSPQPTIRPAPAR
jgi:hypothetical protein